MSQGLRSWSVPYRLEGVSRALAHLVRVHLLEKPIAARAVTDGGDNAHTGMALEVTDSGPKQAVESDGGQVDHAVDRHDLPEAHGVGLAAQFRHLKHERVRRHSGLYMLRFRDLFCWCVEHVIPRLSVHEAVVPVFAVDHLCRPTHSRGVHAAAPRPPRARARSAPVVRHKNQENVSGSRLLSL